ncbi:hypothetical protein Hdeb2414_s0040g00735941 [Helianthus debilis subsp. tardiflorus]
MRREVEGCSLEKSEVPLPVIRPVAGRRACLDRKLRGKESAEKNVGGKRDLLSG